MSEMWIDKVVALQHLTLCPVLAVDQIQYDKENGDPGKPDNLTCVSMLTVLFPYCWSHHPPPVTDLGVAEGRHTEATLSLSVRMVECDYQDLAG